MTKRATVMTTMMAALAAAVLTPHCASAEWAEELSGRHDAPLAIPTGRLPAAPIVVDARDSAHTRDVLGLDDPVADGFRSEVRGAASVRLPQEGVGYLEGYLLEWSSEGVEDSFSVLRRAAGQSAGVRGVFETGSPGLQALVGLRFDSTSADPAEGRARSEGRELEAGLAWNFPGAVGARAFYGYRSDDRDEFGREKERHRLRLELGHNVTDWFRLRVSLLSKIHDTSAIPSERGSYLACIGFVAKY